MLAALLPGLRHAYVDRCRSAIVSSLLSGLFASATVESFHRDRDALGGVFTLVEAGWYAGNIYGAVNAAPKYNLRPISSREGKLGSSPGVAVVGPHPSAFGRPSGVRETSEDQHE